VDQEGLERQKKKILSKRIDSVLQEAYSKASMGYTPPEWFKTLFAEIRETNDEADIFLIHTIKGTFMAVNMDSISAREICGLFNTFGLLSLEGEDDNGD